MITPSRATTPKCRRSRVAHLTLGTASFSAAYYARIGETERQVGLALYEPTDAMEALLAAAEGEASGLEIWDETLGTSIPSRRSIGWAIPPGCRCQIGFGILLQGLLDGLVVGADAVEVGRKARGDRTSKPISGFLASVDPRLWDGISEFSPVLFEPHPARAEVAPILCPRRRKA